MKKFAVLLACLVMAFTSAFVFTGCSCNSGGNVIRLNEVTHSIFYAPLYVAINKGYFADEGLTIELTNGGGANNSMTAVLTGSADIGLMGPEAAIYTHQQGAGDKAIIFGQLTKRDGSFLVSKTARPSFQWSDLIGTTVIGGRAGGVPAMTLQYIIEEINDLTIGTQSNQVNLRTDVEFNATAATFHSTDAEFCTLFEPTASTICQQYGYHIVSSVGTASGEVPYTAFMAKQSYINNNSEKIVKFMRAIIRGYRFLTSAQPQGIAEAIEPSFVGTTDDIIISSINNYVSADSWASSPIMQESAFSRLQDIMINAAAITTRSTFSEVVNNTYAEQAIASLN